MRVKCEEAVGFFGIGRGSNCAFGRWALTFDALVSSSGSSTSRSPPPPSTNYYPRPPPPWTSTAPGFTPQTTPTTVRVPTASYTTTKKSAKGVKVGLGVGLSIACSICAWFVRFFCCGQRNTSSDPETGSARANLAQLRREAPVAC
jgi:hypothetical protein